MRPVLACTCAVAGVLGFAVSPAFAAPGAAPKVEETSLTNVRDSSATFQATINPEGAATSYTFEYAPVGGSFVPVSGAEGQGSVGEGTSGVSVKAHVQTGLNPNTEYQFRVTAVNAIESVTGEVVSFTTQRTGVPFSLPDERSWEMVSPPQKEGVQLGWILESPVQAAANGDAFTDWTFFQSDEPNPAGSSNENAIVFGRGPGGWSSRMIAPPHEHFTGVSVGQGPEYPFFSEDLSKSILQPFGGFDPLSPEATEVTPYVRSDYINGDPSQPCTSNCYTPLVTAGNTPPGTKFGVLAANGNCESVICGPHVLEVTPDLSHVVIESGTPLTPTPTYAGEVGSLYEWSAGKLTYVGEGELGANLGEGKYERHTISSDGSRVIFDNVSFVYGAAEGLKGLLMRDTVTGKLVRLDAPNADAPPLAEESEAQYTTASSDGSKVFFLDSPGLTAESSTSGTDLYEYDVDAPEGEKLTDLSVDRNGSEAANVSTVIDTSEDGSYVYFTATGVLAPGATSAGCESGCVYVSHNGIVKFIASAAESLLFGEPTHMPARVSPNGLWLAFMSSKDLTGYDTDDAVSGQPDQEVYLYNAAADKLVCASCNPTGARPVGFTNVSGNRVYTGDEYIGAPIAASVPAWTPHNLGATLYQSRYLSNSGRLFFNGYDALSTQDVDGTGDVYEYEPPGVGDCSSSGTTFSTRADGCIGLISAGTSSQESAFLDASETGGDVFFLTASKLVNQDFDNAPDIYEARECSAASPCIPQGPVAPPPCETSDSCKPAPSPQPTIFGSPSSATFSGAGNVTVQGPAPAAKARVLTRAQKLAQALRACGRLKAKHKRLACQQRARRTYGKKLAASKVSKSRDGSSHRTGR